MANWNTLKTAIASIINSNGNQEITGSLLQNALNNIITNIGENATFVGVATPGTNPGAPDGPVFYLAATAGTYSNFNGIVINSGEAVILLWSNGSWSKKSSGFATTGAVTKVSSNEALIQNFEFGGIDSDTGRELDSNTRLRSFLIGINHNSKNPKKRIKLIKPESLSIRKFADKGGRLGIFKYVNDSFIGFLTDVTIENEYIVFNSDETFNGIKIMLVNAVSSDSIISESEKMACYAYVESNDILELKNDVSKEGNVIAFEYGGFNILNGALLENELRIRTKPMNIARQNPGVKEIVLSFPDTLELSLSTSELYSAYGYLGKVPVKNLNATLNGKILRFYYDGTYDNIRIALKRKDDSTITDDERKESSAAFSLENIEDTEITDLEYGGIDNTIGTLLQNKLRIRSRQIFVSGLGYKALYYNIPSTLTVASKTEANGKILYSAFAYLGDSPLKRIPSLYINNGFIRFYSDGTFDNIRVSFKRADGDEISEDELNNSLIYTFKSLADRIVDLENQNTRNYKTFNEKEILESGNLATSNGAIISNLYNQPSQWGKRFVSTKYIYVRDTRSIAFHNLIDYDIAIFEYDDKMNRVRSTGWLTENEYLYVPPFATPYIKILGKPKDNNTTFVQAGFIEIEMLITSKHSKLKRVFNTKKGTSPNNIENSINIECAMHYSNPLSCLDTTTAIQDGNTELYPNYGLLLLPSTYRNTGKPTPLLVFCHGYGGHYEYNSETIASTSYLNTEYLLKEGYAVLDIDGNLLDRTKPHACSQMGIDAYIKGIKWAQDRYNVTSDIYLAGHSMGGMMASLLSTMGNSIHIKACCLFSPASSVILLMQLHPEHRSDMSRYYGFEGKEPTWGTSADFTTEEKQYIMNNIEKVMKGSILWNYTNIIPSELKGLTHKYKSTPTAEESEFYNSKSRILPHAPTKVFQGTTDTSCKKEWTDEFVKLCKNGGMNIEYRIMDGVPHTGVSGITAVGDNTVITINGETVNGVPTALYEMVRFFRRYS